MNDRSFTATFATAMDTMDTNESEILIDAKFGVCTDPDTHEVTLFISNQPWGPVVTGKTLEEAKAKMKDAFILNMVAHSFCELVERTPAHADLREVEEIKRVEATKASIDKGRGIRKRLERELDETLSECV